MSRDPSPDRMGDDFRRALRDTLSGTLAAATYRRVPDQPWPDTEPPLRLDPRDYDDELLAEGHYPWPADTYQVVVPPLPGGWIVPTRSATGGTCTPYGTTTWWSGPTVLDDHARDTIDRVYRFRGDLWAEARRAERRRTYRRRRAVVGLAASLVVIGALWLPAIIRGLCWAAVLVGAALIGHALLRQQAAEYQPRHARSAGPPRGLP